MDFRRAVDGRLFVCGAPPIEGIDFFRDFFFDGLLGTPYSKVSEFRSFSCFPMIPFENLMDSLLGVPQFGHPLDDFSA